MPGKGELVIGRGTTNPTSKSLRRNGIRTDVRAHCQEKLGMSQGLLEMGEAVITC